MQITWEHYRKWLGEQLTGDLPALPPPAVNLWNRDTRTLVDGQWYLPIKGETFDGHKFIEQALDRGAAGFLYQIGADIPDRWKEKGFAVKDSLTAIQRIASGWRHEIPTKFIALTGSAGKTTVKELTHLILSRVGKTVSTFGSYNNELGVPLTLISVPAATRFAVLEMGARKPGNISFLVQMAAPDVGAVLNVGTAHLGIFGSRENLLRTKTEMFRDSPPHTILVSPAFDPKVKGEAIQTGKKVITFGEDENAHIWVRDIEWHRDGSQTFELCHANKSYPITLQVSHQMYPPNVAAAAAIAFASGIDLQAVADALSTFTGLDGRYKIHRRNGQIVIDDSYNANPESTRAGLTSVERSFAGKKTLIVLGDMLELGDESSQSHFDVGAFAAKHVRPAEVWSIGAFAQNVASGVSSVNQRIATRTFADVQSCIDQAERDTKAFEVIYLKGSNSIRLSQLMARLVEPV